MVACFESHQTPKNTNSSSATGATAYARDEYLPQPRPEREGIALCLSGGGFRAALFHLGALGRLNELGILSLVDKISSVSGGSIIAAHLAARVYPWLEAQTVGLRLPRSLANQTTQRVSDGELWNPATVLCQLAKAKTREGQFCLGFFSNPSWVPD